MRMTHHSNRRSDPPDAAFRPVAGSRGDKSRRPFFQAFEDAFRNLSDGLPFVPRGGFDLPAPGNCRAFTGAALLFLTSNTLSGKIVCGWRFLKHC